MQVEVTNQGRPPPPPPGAASSSAGPTANLDQSSIQWLLDSVRNAMVYQAMALAERDRIHQATIIKEAYEAGFAQLQKMAETLAKSQQGTNELVNTLIGRLRPMANDAGETANEIKKESAKKKPRKQLDISVDTFFGKSLHLHLQLLL
jgi:hypothetical protein